MGLVLCYAFGMISEQVKTIVSEFHAQLQQLYGERLEQVILFGSQARGDAIEGSDIDMMIVLKGNVSIGEEIARTSEICSRLSLINDVALSRIFLSSERFKHERTPLLLNVYREGVFV